MSDTSAIALERPEPHHVALTVTDLQASIGWYEELFSISYRMAAPHAGGVAKLLADDDFSLVIVLHQHDGNDGGAFSETRTGLDHLGFRVPDRARLEAWQVRLEQLGVQRSDEADRPLTQSPIADTPHGCILVFRDPDNIQLELISPTE
ncbi:MAG: VOC family protein [Actinomycetota bacterium]|jgi:catechol 2,3-dioxygenase-like lactoylglutathione lyase family enzyme|nr:VOC family protein [Actinomycetota bacterium]